MRQWRSAFLTGGGNVGGTSDGGGTMFVLAVSLVQTWVLGGSSLFLLT